MQIFLRFLEYAGIYAEDKNRRHRWVDVCSKREREGPEIVASSLSASSLLLSLYLSLFLSSATATGGLSRDNDPRRVPMCRNNHVLREKTVVVGQSPFEWPSVAQQTQSLAGK